VLHVLIEEEACFIIAAPEHISMPVVSQPTEWNPDDGLGCMKGLRNAVPFFTAFWLCVGIVVYLVTH
jgi:hypothetical protein